MTEPQTPYGSRTIIFIPDEAIQLTYANTDGAAMDIEDLGPMTLDSVDGRLWGINSKQEPEAGTVTT